MAVSKMDFEKISKRVQISSTKRLDYMKVVVESTDVGSKDSSSPASVYITDVMLQGGTVATSWVGHVSEIKWSFDMA